MWTKTLTLLLPLLAAASSNARPAEADKAMELSGDELRYTVSALTEMLLPAQLLACQVAYPGLYADSESWLKRLPHGAADDPDKLPMIAGLEKCFAAAPPLTRQQCVDITDTVTKLGQAGSAWTASQFELAQSYLAVTRQTLPALKASIDHCHDLSGQQQR